MKRLRILMADFKSYYPSPAYQLGLLAAYATKDTEIAGNVEFTFLELPREMTPREIARAIHDADADLIAASSYAWTYKKICDVLDLFDAAEASLPYILLGGPNTPGRFGDLMLERYPIVSALVEGEGEPAFLDICRSLIGSPQENPFVGSRNCVSRAEDGSIVRANLGHRIQFLDEVPSPYLTGILPVHPSPVFYETNRGCPYRCAFCYWGNGNSKIFRMSHERLAEEMAFFARNKVSSFWIADANFGIFKDDAEIAQLMVDVNAIHGYPFQHVGVNWAKNSSDKVLEIATIFRSGRIGCTTTLAIQTVTTEAEEKSKRYSMPATQFAHLISSAEEREIDTYTDLIWGLPGENVEEYLEGLEAVVSTGVPAILIHQLYLLPGTELYEDRERLGLEILSEYTAQPGTDAVAPDELSEFWSYIVVCHPKMSRADMRRGTRLMGINHLLHNHDLGKVVNFFLTRYSITPRQVYNFFDEVLLGAARDVLPEVEENNFLREVRHLILDFTERIGLDEFYFYRRLSEAVWLHEAEHGRRSREPEVRAFMRRFYAALAQRFEICQDGGEAALLGEIVDYNVLISPKPAWTPEPQYTFSYDVDAIWRDMLQVIHTTDPLPARKVLKGTDRKSWPERARLVFARLADSLSDEYLASRRRETHLGVRNPWFIPPNRQTADWLLSSRSKHCVVVSKAAPSPVA